MQFRLSGSRKKVLLFAVVGAVGALLAGLADELLLLWTSRPPIVRPKPLAVCLTLDCSGSMAETTGFGSKLEEMKAAALAFVGRHAADESQMALVRFSDKVEVAAPLSKSHDSLSHALRSLTTDGLTDMGAALRTAMAQLEGISVPGNILLFTDGMPTAAEESRDPRRDTLQAAAECRKRGLKILVIATGDAVIDYLGELTADPRLVFRAEAGDFDKAFQKAEEVVFRKSMVESGPKAKEQPAAGSPAAHQSQQAVKSGPTAEDLAYEAFRTGTWTALVAMGIGLALIVGQNLYLRRKLLAWRQMIVGSLGGLVAGLVAGALGQLLFAGVPEVSRIVETLGRLAGWTVLGSLLGAGLAFFLPNLGLLRGAAGGTVGGLAGGAAFPLLGLVSGDIGGRLFGVAILGFCIGIMIALAEVAFREAWLEIRYGPREIRTVSLGRKPVAIGSNPEVCTVWVQDAPALALRYVFREGRITCEDVPSAQTFDVLPGDQRRVAKVTVVVCTTARVPAAQSREDRGAPGDAQLARQAASPPAESSGLRLRIRGRAIPLAAGLKLNKSEIVGLETRLPDGTVAEVVPNPNDPSVLGLKNHSTIAWKATLPGGEERDVAPGRSIRLAAGTKVRFGSLEGVIE